MINSSEFSKRLEKVIHFYDESASSFAEKIGVQRSSISHILSGRNKPSLDFVLKVLDAFPEVELYWLLNGKGTFPKKNTPTRLPTNLETTETTATKNSEQITNTNSDTKEIERIVIFFKDGTFKNFNK